MNVVFEFVFFYRGWVHCCVYLHNVFGYAEITVSGGYTFVTLAASVKYAARHALAGLERVWGGHSGGCKAGFTVKE